MKARSSITQPLVIAVALATALSLSGCFANPLDAIGEQIGEQIGEGLAGGVESLIEKATGADIDIETGGTLPADFPDEVPLVEGAIGTATALGLESGKTWSVLVVVNDAAAAMSLARQKLIDAGFEESVWKEGTMAIGAFGSESYSVMVSNGGDSGDQPTITYLVTSIASE